MPIDVLLDAADDDGWAALFKKGAWHDGILFSVAQHAAFAPVQSRSEVYALFDQARAALAAT